MKKVLFVVWLLLSFHFAQSQNQWGIELTGGVGYANQFTPNDLSYNNIYNFGFLVSFQQKDSPWSFYSGSELLYFRVSPDVIRIPLKANYSFGEKKRFFVGSGAYFNYIISEFTNTSGSLVGITFETGYKIPLSKKISFIPRLSYSYDLGKYDFEQGSYNNKYLLLNFSFKMDL